MTTRLMRRCSRHLLSLCALLSSLAISSAALAQGFGRPGRMPQQRQPKASKPAGPAEPADKSKSGEPDLPALPKWPGQDTKKLQFLQLKGYFRFRADMMHNLNLGQPETIGIAAPYFTPISENDRSTFKCANRVGKAPTGGTPGDRDLDDDDCPGNTLGGANIRLRIEPTINVSENVRVKMQLDIFDNLSMGSTPDGTFLDAGNRAPHVPLTAFTQTQAPPIAGRNTRVPGILVKRVWAEVKTPLGLLKFGRMPSHWGLGLIANNGQCWDCNFGDNADRIMFATELFGHKFGMAYDFAATGPSNLTVENGKRYFDGVVIDLEQLDDVDQLVWFAGKIDSPSDIKDKVEQGKLVLNYGVYLVYRKQDFDYFAGTGVGSSIDTHAQNLIERKAWALIPDLWFKLMYKKLSIEFEGVLIGGKIGTTTDSPNSNDSLDILQFGWVLRSSYKLLRDQLKIGLEIGMASGDQAEDDRSDYNRRRTLVLQDPADNKLNEFRFDFDYLVDLILFRELIGTVSNAVYFKPSVQYDLLDSFGARLDIIYSLAHRPVAFPGNSPHLGLEFDLDIYYRNVQEGFYAGIQYGLLIPFAGLDRPGTIYTGRGKDAEVAQTLQARLMVKF